MKRNSEYHLARLANLEAAARGQIKIAILPRREVPPSETFEPVTGWRKLIVKVRRQATTNTRMAAILPTREEIEATK